MVLKMKYADGQDVKLGDMVVLWGDCSGVVICSIDTDEYISDFPKEEWQYLTSGVIVRTKKSGLIHYIEPDEDFKLIGRSALLRT